MKNRFLTILIALLLTNINLMAFQQDPVYSVFLVGDAGEPIENPVLTKLKDELAKIGDKGAVIYLGDNIYPQGLPPKGHPLRAEAEVAINGQINAVKDFQGRRVFIPGNHDWAQGRAYGLEWLNIQEEYVENALDSADVWLPTGGCPGPFEVELTDKITLITIDTQWFLHKGNKPTEACGVTSITDVAALFQDALLRNAHKKVIVASHHPMYTYGIHGGVFSVKDHIFPLTASKSIPTPISYLPLPVIGSIYPLYRKWFGNIQDTPHPQYKRFRDGMVQLMSKHPDIIHVAGHEHALEHIEKEGMHFVVSGAGAKNNARVKKKGDAQFASNTMGYARLDYFANGQTKLSFFTPDQGDVKELYTDIVSERPFAPAPEDLMARYSRISFAGKDTLFSASKKYIGRSKFHKSLLGENHRQEWATELRFPIFDIATEKGGLRILKKGGGHQTTSLRLEASDGKQYVLRSMDKNPALTLPPELRNTFIKSVVQDGISASHPYAPLVVPALADAAGIFHANPKIVYIPDDPRFGIYRKELANSLALFEERVNKKQVKEEMFGAGDDVISSPDLYIKLKKDNDNKVDEKFVVRNRLFDMWLGDWDRHDDQWRWIEYDKKDDKNIYQPIPRDRDQVFFAGEGSFKKLAASKWAQPAFKGFEENISYTPAYGFYRIRWFDRYFMTEPSLEDWVNQANELKAALTDEVIESAIGSWPKEIFDLRGEEIIRKLKNRRDKFPEWAADYYKFISKGVDVRGSDKREYFLVERLDDENTKVTMYKISKKGNRDEVLYQRTFKTSVTDEVRLFGFGGEDEFELRGNTDKGILIRIIAGEDDDKIIDESSVRKGKKKTIVYDNIAGTELTASKETKDLRSDTDPAINRYNMEEFDFDVRMPLLSFNFNPDDGLFLGAGFMFKKDGFRKEPFASQQSFTANYALATSSYNLEYNGEFIDVFGKADFLLDASLKAPNFVNNFFGLGNETVYDDDIELTFYRTRFTELLVNPSVNLNLGDKGNINIGARYQSIDIQRSNDRFIADFVNNGLDPNGLFQTKKYAGASIGLHFDTKDNAIVPKRGITFNTEVVYNAGLNNNSSNSTQWNSDVTFRWALGAFSRTSIATRVNYQRSFGDFEFFQASKLDGFNTLRGFRRYRFAGESSFSHQLDLRVDLFEWNNYILPSKVGLILFNDLGRVWVDGEDSNTLHHGYGGGIYLTPFSTFAVNILLAKSEESFAPLVKFGFYF
ncbi:BamA/TamA family outer membrane protein [Roseivirga sp. E12]|uniref:BamA/TamA family outer membrane protein n=1 Tax=Roseivirga sp. E12 TaxID=2819237 RepID=UPI001ABC48C9|nr:BamA/TamA family outer membrane protein [Roseivirga sp. E12]MBO3699970.1 metallophosphoesterase [Roseivirga sp. E12]